MNEKVGCRCGSCIPTTQRSLASFKRSCRLIEPHVAEPLEVVQVLSTFSYFECIFRILDAESWKKIFDIDQLVFCFPEKQEEKGG